MVGLMRARLPPAVSTALYNVRPRALATLESRPFCRNTGQVSSNGANMPLEEQALQQQQGKRYYPVHIGQTFQDRYRVITKLGYGAFSTVWLARDQKTSKYIALKMCIQTDDENGSVILDEIKNLKRIAEYAQHQTEPTFARTADDIFEVDGPHGRHFCIAMEPQGCSLYTLSRMFDKRQVPKELVKDYIHRVILCVNWLQAVCDVMHCDITSANVLTRLASDATFERLEKNEIEDPSPAVFENDHPFYPSSHATPRDIFDLDTEPALTDFGVARQASVTHRGWGMAHTHRAPEILIGLPWSCEIDTWSIGIMTLELLEGKSVFIPFHPKTDEYVYSYALSQYISLLGPPPLHLLQRSENPDLKLFFDEQGNWILDDLPIPDKSLEDFVTVIPPGEEKTKFLNFIRRILTWDPAERVWSAHLFADEWFWPDGLPAGAADG